MLTEEIIELEIIELLLEDPEAYSFWYGVHSDAEKEEEEGEEDLPF